MPTQVYQPKKNDDMASILPVVGGIAGAISGGQKADDGSGGGFGGALQGASSGANKGSQAAAIGDKFSGSQSQGTAVDRRMDFLQTDPSTELRNAQDSLKTMSPEMQQAYSEPLRKALAMSEQSRPKRPGQV